MLWVALKMLIEERGKYFGMIAGVFFAALIITQQLSIFVGIISRTISFLEDTSLPDIWVVDQKAQYVDDIKPMKSTSLLQVKGIEGVDWAVPMYKGNIKARLSSGTFQTCNLIGLDDVTLIGGPGRMAQGKLSDLRRADGIIVDENAARNKLAKRTPSAAGDGPPIPLQIGDTVELNDNRAVVVGIARTTRAFQSQPMIYTTYSRATTFAPRERKLLSFILVKAQPGVSPAEVAKRITERTGLKALQKEELKWMTVRYYMKNTGIPINFGIAVVLGLLIGTAIAGQTFYSFTADNLRYFGTLKAMGASNGTLLKMVMAQASLVGVMGYGLGVGMASLTSVISKNSELAFRFPWQLLAISAGAVIFICIISALFSIRKVLTLEPAIVFKG